jgi:predicted house-cleaning NTP pyrophosphatase (Maf/HAM1 superfamily)
MATKHETYTLEVEVGFSTEWIPSHIEEGHGYHEMGNYNSLELGRIIIKLANGNEIDITDQLDEETHKAIFNEIAEDL